MLASKLDDLWAKFAEGITRAGCWKMKVYFHLTTHARSLLKEILVMFCKLTSRPLRALIFNFFAEG